MKYHKTDKAPAAGGHYSQAVEANGIVYVSGQLPIRIGGGIPDGIAEQTRQALANVAGILEAAGSDMASVVSATVFVQDIALWPEVNRIWAEVFGDHRPARTVAVSPQLHYGALIEVQTIALIRHSEG